MIISLATLFRVQIFSCFRIEELLTRIKLLMLVAFVEKLNAFSKEFAL